MITLGVNCIVALSLQAYLLLSAPVGQQDTIG